MRNRTYIPRAAMVFFSVLLAATTSSLAGADQKRLRPLPSVDRNRTTGPEVGKKIPKFKGIDQNGNPQTFETLRGPKGLVLLFVRSADW